MERNNQLDVVRCFANYMIVLLHAGAAFQYCNPKCIEYKTWVTICWDICPAALPALFLISGYLLFNNFNRDSYGRKMISRVKRLLVPYLIWNITFVAFYLICGHFVPRLSARVSAFGLNTLQGCFDKVISLTIPPIDGPLWFLRTLIIFAIISPIMWLFIRNKAGRFIGGGIIVTLYILEYYLGIIYQISMVVPLYGLTMFYLGGIINVTNGFSGTFNWFKSKLWFISPIIAIIPLAFFTINNYYAESNINIALADDLCKLMMTPLLFVVVNQLKIAKITTNKVYNFMKEMSFFAYAGHFLFCSMLMHTAASFLGFMETGKFTILVFIFVGVGVPVMAGIYWIGKKYLPHIMKLYDGTL